MTIQTNQKNLQVLKNQFSNLKEDFIRHVSNGNENTELAYSRILSKAQKFEEQLGKDMSEFDFDEVNMLMGYLNASTISSVQTQHNIIKQYIQYAINNGYGNPLQINYAEMLQVKDFYQYINKIKSTKQIIDREDIIDIIESSDLYGGNAQDYCPIVMIFNGVWGRNLEELINLRKSDIDMDNSSLLLRRNNGKQRIISIEKEWIQYLLYASEETEYITITEEKTITRKLMDTPYLLRRTTTKRNQNGNIKISPAQLRQRITKVRDFWGNRYINPTSILRSGMIAYAKKYKVTQDKSHLETVDYMHIAERFSIDPKNWFSLKRNIKIYVDPDVN
jgi:integrase